MCGVCGDTGFPGEVEVDSDIVPPMPVRFASCRLETVEERLSCMEEVMDSVNAALDSLIIWNLDNWATVLLVADSPFLVGSKDLSVFLLSSAFRKSEMSSSSV